MEPSGHNGVILTLGTSIVFSWYAEAMLAIRSERVAKDKNQPYVNR